MLHQKFSLCLLCNQFLRMKLTYLTLKDEQKHISADVSTRSKPAKGHQNIIKHHSASESCASFDACADSVYQALLSAPTFREPGYEANFPPDPSCSPLPSPHLPKQLRSHEPMDTSPLMHPSCSPLPSPCLKTPPALPCQTTQEP